MSDEKSLFSVLVVEGDPIASHLFKKSLEEDRRSAYQVDLVSNIPEAIRKLEKNSYHVLLVESDSDEESVMIESLRELHGDELDVPIVLLTSSHHNQIAEQAERMGISRLVVKSENNYQELSDILKNSYQSFHQAHPESPETSNKAEPKNRMKEIAGKAEDALFDSATVSDELTGLCNHTSIHERMLKEYKKAAEFGIPLSCLMVDIDHFKTINAKYGHKVGDDILKACAEILFENCRLTDIAARYGGEEFAFLLPLTGYDGAKELAERLRRVFANKMFKIDDDEFQLTISVGISAFPDDPIDRCADMPSYADEALFRAKTLGRNRVVLYRDLTGALTEGLPSVQVGDEQVSHFQRKMGEIANVARRAYVDISKELIKTLEDQDRYMAGHSKTCSEYALCVAQAMGLSAEDAEVVQHAALLHDIGKISIPTNILLKPSQLSFIEFEAMKQHPYLGYKILKPIRFLQQEALLVLHHHEWYNGEGYPCRMKGNEIPIGARIIAVVDSYDTMRLSGGRYKQNSSIEDVMQELILFAGTQFDPLVLKAFIEVLVARGELLPEQFDQRRLNIAVRKVSNPA